LSDRTNNLHTEEWTIKSHSMTY